MQPQQRADDEGPVYYREIQKNAYLKRIPCDVNGKLRPLNNKKPPYKPMWTQFCVHNGRTPYLEQYPEPESPATLSHLPVWRACLRGARHVTHSVTPYVGGEHDFLIDTDRGPVRMLAPDWASMQDWVSCLRVKLQELKALPRSENVYCAPPAPPPPRAAARDPTSPLPAPPHPPPQRVPGIEITVPTSTRQNVNTNQTENETINTGNQISTSNSEVIDTTLQTIDNSVSTTNIIDTTQSGLNNETNNDINNLELSENEEEIEYKQQTTINNQRHSINNPEEFQNIPSDIENVDISDWESTDLSLPTTSQERKNDIPTSCLNKKSVAKICGQNICLDDSIFKRMSGGSDTDYLQDIENFNSTIDNLDLSEIRVGEFTQTVVVNSNGNEESTSDAVELNGQPVGTNVTVIQVSNKRPPHTAIPVMGKATDVFDFDFKLNTQANKTTEPKKNYVNIVHTQNSTEKGYGTIFTSKENEYGHISLTTTVNLTGNPTTSINTTDANVSAQDDGIYERLCMASTSKELKRIKQNEVARKASLPNLEVNNGNPTYEYIFPGNSGSVAATNIHVNDGSVQVSTVTSDLEQNYRAETSNTRINQQPQRLPPTPTSQAAVSNPVPLATRSSIERSNSHNDYDNVRRVHSPRREGKSEKTEFQPPNKAIWKRGLTELSLLTKLRGLTVKKTQISDAENRTESTKVVHRSRADGRLDSNRRRSSSLSEEPRRLAPLPPLTPRHREAQRLAAEQARGSAVAGTIPQDAVLAQYNDQVWVASWGGGGVGGSAGSLGGRCGDRVRALRAQAVRGRAHAADLLHQQRHTEPVKILFHRVPLAKIFVLTKMTDNETLGIKLDSECNIVSIAPNSPASRAGLPAAGWAVTEVNNRPVNLIKGGDDDLNRLSRCGKEISVLIQPSPLVKKLRSALKSSKSLISFRS